jgi:hypothetical protein
MTRRAVRPDSAEKTVRDIRRATRRQYSAEEKIRIVLGGGRCHRHAGHGAADVRSRAGCDRSASAPAQRQRAILCRD